MKIKDGLIVVELDDTNLILDKKFDTVDISPYSGAGNLKFLDLSNTNAKGFHSSVSLPSLEKIILPKTLKIIEACTLSETKNLKEIIFPENLERIEDYAFENSKVEKVDFSKTNLSYIGPAAFKDCKNLKEVILPKGIKIINASAFINCKNLKEIYFPNSITNIASNAFSNCKLLEKVVFEKDSIINLLGDFVFRNCEKLEKIELPESLYTFRTACFEGTNITLIKIPKNTCYFSLDTSNTKINTFIYEGNNKDLLETLNHYIDEKVKVYFKKEDYLLENTSCFKNLNKMYKEKDLDR